MGGRGLDQGGSPNLLSALTRKIVSLCEMWLEGIWNGSLGRYCIPGLEPSGLVTLYLCHIRLCGVSTKDHWCSLIFHTWILLNKYLLGCWMLFEQFSESSSSCGLTLSSSCGCFTGHWVYESLDTVPGTLKVTSLLSSMSSSSLSPPYRERWGIRETKPAP